MKFNPFSSYYQYYLFFEYILMKIIGLSPWTVNTSGRIRITRTSSYKLSANGSFYNFLLFLANGILVYFRIFGESSSVQVPMKTFQIIAVQLSNFFIVSTSFLPIIYVIRQKFLVRVSNCFEIVDRKLINCTDYQIITAKNNFVICVSNIVQMCGLAIGRGLHYDFYSVVVISLPFFVGSWVIIQYTILINMMRARFESINSALSKLGTPKSDVSFGRSVLDDIDNIKYAYVEISSMCDDISSFFGISMMIVVIVFSVRNILNCFQVIRLIIGEIEFETVFIVTGLFTVQFMYLFMKLTSTVTEIEKQNLYTARILDVLLDRYAMDEQVFKKLEKFSNDLWHLTVDFTACDMIPLNRTLIGIISGTTVTYLVIAYQFHFSTI